MKSKALIVNDTRVENHAGCSLVMKNLIELLSFSCVEPIYFHPVSKPWKDSKIFMQAFHDADCVIVNGEGSVHSSNFRARMLSELGRFCRKLRKNSFFINGTLYNNNKYVLEGVGQYDHIWVRDRHSLMEISKFNDTAEITPDFSFLSDLSFLRGKSLGIKNYPIITDSVVKKDINFLKDLACEVNADYVPIRDNVKVGDEDIFFCPLLADYKVAIVARYHAACLCINMGVPFIAIESNTPKISFLLDDVFNNHNRLCDIEKVKEKIATNTSFSKEECICIESYKRDGMRQFYKLARKIKNSF